MDNKTIANIFKDAAIKIENGTCNLDKDELELIAKSLVNIKLNIEQTCDYINCSRPSLYRLIETNKLPNPHKDKGGKKYWYQSELDEYLSNLN